MQTSTHRCQCNDAAAEALYEKRLHIRLNYELICQTCYTRVQSPDVLFAAVFASVALQGGRPVHNSVTGWNVKGEIMPPKIQKI